jgi:hypothetical protein
MYKFIYQNPSKYISLGNIHLLVLHYTIFGMFRLILSDHQDDKYKGTY